MTFEEAVSDMCHGNVAYFADWFTDEGTHPDIEGPVIRRYVFEDGCRLYLRTKDKGIERFTPSAEEVESDQWLTAPRKVFWDTVYKHDDEGIHRKLYLRNRIS